MKQFMHVKMVKCAFLSLFCLLCLHADLSNCFVHIELKKSTAKYRSEYLNSLKFMQKTIKSPMSSFLEEKEISLHQQVLAQKRLATYYGELNVGYGRDGDPSKTQTFKMLFDTGSCEFWIPSDDCFTNRCLTHSRYTGSATLKNFRNAKMQIQYLSGKVEGDMVLETIGLGELIIKDQVIGIAREVEIPLLDEVIWDGILGLAYPNKNLRAKKISPLMDNIIQQDLLHRRGEKNQFAYYLGLDKGAITFGGADMKFKKNLDEEFKWAPISEKNYWTITLMDIKKYKPGSKEPDNNDTADTPMCPFGCKSIVDTGTYLIYGPSDQLQSFLSDMTLNKCEEKSSLPALGLIFKGYPKNGKEETFELLLTPDDYVLEFEVNGKTDCVIGIGSDNEDSGWTLGQVFLKAYYTVFDRESEAVGFAKSNPDPGIITEVKERNSLNPPIELPLANKNSHMPLQLPHKPKIHNNMVQNMSSMFGPKPIDYQSKGFIPNGPISNEYFLSSPYESQLVSFIKTDNNI